jgi:hypothetical protein
MALTKAAIVVRSDLLAWQKLNVAAFLATSFVIEDGTLAGEPYLDQGGTQYARLTSEPMLIYAGDLAALHRALDRALSRGLIPAVYVQEMFATMDDESNRMTVRQQQRGSLNLAGIAVRGERKIVDKALDGLRLHE